jgi:hypothetical protein
MPIVNSGEDTTFPAGFRLRLNACSAYVQLPFLQSVNFDEAAVAYWHDGSVVNTGLTSVGMGVHTDARRKELMRASWPVNVISKNRRKL